MVTRCKAFSIFFSLLFIATGSFAQVVVTTVSSRSAKSQWVDSVYNTLSQEQRIGQLFMIAAYSGGSNYNEPEITKLINNSYIGGLIFMQGTAEAQAQQTNKYQKDSKVPLLIGMDAEWGLGMRLTGVKDLPHSMMVGATADTSLAYRIGAAIAYQCRRMGVHINFGPVLDVNNNPKNPIINARSFGENKYLVAAQGKAYTRGLQDNGVIACGKHFPGHGDTETDSHKDLPTISKTLAQLQDLELYPFKELISDGIQSMMVAHLDVPTLESAPHTPTTLSQKTITGLLKEDMGFKGLIFTDALNMQGVAKYYAPGDVDLKAFMAGNDVLLFSQDVPTAVNKIKEAMANGEISEARLAESVKKILAAKYEVGLNTIKTVDPKNATTDLNNYTETIRYQLAQASFTIIRDKNKLLAKTARGGGKIGYVGINASNSTVLYNKLKEERGNIKAVWVPKGSSSTTASAAVQAADASDVTIVAVHDMSFYPTRGNDYGLDTRQMSLLKQLQSKSKVMIVVLGNPYLFQHFCDYGTAMVAYEDYDQTEEVAASVILGVGMAKGRLPVTPCPTMKPGPKVIYTEAGITQSKTDSKPAVAAASGADKLTETQFVEDAGVVNPDKLYELNLFIQKAIAEGTFPGCQIVAAKDGKIFYNRSFGYYDYSKTQRVDSNTLYDVASLTKVMATTLAVMRLYESGQLDLDKKVSDYLPLAVGSDKANLKIRDMLLHQAGLKSWIPFYKETVDDKYNLLPTYYKAQAQTGYGIEVSKNLYLRSDYDDTIWNRILTSPLENRGRYVYSDLDFYFLAAIVQQITGQRLDVYVEEQFYKPLGLTHTTYRPLKKFKQSDIAPTEDDIYFRHHLVQGYVHDQGAAMFGGIAGHAGVFSTAKETAIIFHMLMNGGHYNGKQFFKKSTIDYFTAYNSRLSRRGLGFDKPDADASDGGPAGDRTSGYAFGHQGFTGTCAWADPKTGVVFVFLSNRVNPSAENGKINSKSIRTIAQDDIYEALGLPVNRDRPAVRRSQLAKLK